MWNRIKRFALLTAAALCSLPVAARAGFVEPWQAWSKQPVTAPMIFTTIVNATGGSEVHFTIGGIIYTNTSDGTTAHTNIFIAELEPHFQYPLTISGGSFTSAEVQLVSYISRDKLLKNGSKAIPMPYKIFVNNGETNDFLANFGTSGSYSTNILLEVRPDCGFRPVSMLDSESQWNRDQDGTAVLLGPGDAYLPDIGPGRSTNTWSGGFRWAVNLGRLWNGSTAGMIRLDASILNANLYTAAPLSYTARSTNTAEMMVLTNSSGQLRQIFTPQTLVDIQSTTSPTQQCVLNFYLLSEVGATTNGTGLFPINTNTPFVTWRIKNPDSPGATNRVQFVEERPGGRTNTYQVAYSSPVWTLTSGAGADTITETRTVSVSGATRTETVLIAGAANVYKAVETYQQFPWGWELTGVVSNPDGYGLTNSFTFYTNATETAAYGKLQDHYYPGGYWERTYYVNDGVCPSWPFGSVSDYFGDDYYEVTIRPWEDGPSSPAGATLNNVVQSILLETDISLGTHFSWEHDEYFGPMMSGGSLVSSNQISYSFGDDGADAYGGLTNEDYNTAGNSWGKYAVTTTHTMPGNYVDGLMHNLAHNDTSIDYYENNKGSFSWTTRAFTVNASTGQDFSILITHGSGGILGHTYADDYYGGVFGAGEFCPYDASNQSGQLRAPEVQIGKSTQELDIYQSGNVVYKKLLAMSAIVSSAPVFLPYEQHLLTYDTLGHLTNEVWMDVVNTNITRTLYQASWVGAGGADCELLQWEINETGEQVTYAYDSLKRLTNATHVGVAASGSYPVQASISTNLVYDAANRVTAKIISAGGLSLTNTMAFDLAGRTNSVSGWGGLTTNYTYSADTHTVTDTWPGGVTLIHTSYLDGRPKSLTGTGKVNEFYTYLLTTNDIGSGVPGNGTPSVYPKNVTHTDYGSLGSGRWREKVTDTGHNLFEENYPGFGTSFSGPLQTLYITDGSGIVTSKQIPTNVISGTVVNYEENYYPDGYGGVAETDTATTPMRRTGSDWRYQYDGTNWFLAQFDWKYLGSGIGSGYLTNNTVTRLSGYTNSGIQTDLSLIDPDTNTTRVLVYLNRSTATVTATTNTPQSALVITNVTINGLLQTASSASVVTPAWHYYDALGREIAMKDPLGNVSGTTYDPTTTWVTTTTNAAGNLTTYQYYSATQANAGMLLCQTDPNTKKTWYDYTARGEAQHTWGDVAYPEERVYSGYGELVNLSTFQGGSGWTSPTTWPGSGVTKQTTTWAYDNATGLLLSKADAVGHSYTNNYLFTRTPLTKTWARGVTITYTYDIFGELIEKDYSDGTPSMVYNSVNLLGAPTQITDATGTSVLTYDFNNRLKSTTWTGSAYLFNTLALYNTYSPVYGRNELSLQASSTTLLTHDYLFDTNSGRISIVSNGTFTVSYGYLANSDLLQTTTSKNGGTTVLTATRGWTYGYRLAGITNTVSGSVVTSHAYTYDAVDRRTQATLEDSSEWTYAYNDRNEVTSAKRYWGDSTPVAGQQFQYAFDNIGNRVTASEGGDQYGNNLRTEAYAVNNLNQYSSRTVPNALDVIGVATNTATVSINNQSTTRKTNYYRAQLTLNNSTAPVYQSVTNLAVLNQGTSPDIETNAVGNVVLQQTPENFIYDLDGNSTSDGLWTYFWDAENRLTDMTSTTSLPTAARKKLDFTYDYMGRRVQKIVSTNSGSAWVAVSTNLFVYDGWNLIAILTPQDALVQSFTWGLDLSGTMDGAGDIGGLMISTIYGSSNTNCFPGYDSNGNVLVLADASAGIIDARYEYNPFGKMIRLSGPIAHQNPIRFSTKFWEEETGFIYYGQRYYNACNGRWLRRDSAEESGGANLYSFNLNNAFFNVDFLGDAWHHVATMQLANSLDDGPGTRFLERFTVLAKDPHSYDTAHRAYNQAIDGFFSDWCKAKGITSSQFAKSEKLAQEFVDSIMAQPKTSSIGSYLSKKHD